MNHPLCPGCETVAHCSRNGCVPLVETPDRDLRRDYILRLQYLIAEAEQDGMVLTVEQHPLFPPAMGKYETVVSVRPKRDCNA